jgi:hypothetical protein
MATTPYTFANFRSRGTLAKIESILARTDVHAFARAYVLDVPRSIMMIMSSPSSPATLRPRCAITRGGRGRRVPIAADPGLPAIAGRVVGAAGSSRLLPILGGTTTCPSPGHRVARQPPGAFAERSSGEGSFRLEQKGSF